VPEETIRVLTPENIDKIVRSVEAQCEKEHNTENLKRISKLIKENEIATANLIKAIEAGKAVDVISAQIEKRQAEKVELEAQLAKEKIQTPLLKYEQIRFFFERFTKGDADDINYRRALVDIFINKIYLYDNHIKIYYNAQEGQINVPINELELSSGSPMGHLVEANRSTLSLYLKNPRYIGNISTAIFYTTQFPARFCSRMSAIQKS
jgi:hypothetical protein